MLARHAVIHAALLEEAIQLVARLDAECQAQLVGGQRAGLVGGERKRLQRLPIERWPRPAEAVPRSAGMCTSTVLVSGIGGGSCR